MKTVYCMHCGMDWNMEIGDECFTDSDLSQRFAEEWCEYCQHKVYFDHVYYGVNNEENDRYYVNVDFRDGGEEEIWKLNSDCAGFSDHDSENIEYDKIEYENLREEQRQQYYRRCDMCENVFKKGTGYCKRLELEDMFYCKNCYFSKKRHEYAYGI